MGFGIGGTPPEDNVEGELVLEREWVDMVDRVNVGHGSFDGFDRCSFREASQNECAYRHAAALKSGNARAEK